MAIGVSDLLRTLSELVGLCVKSIRLTLRTQRDRAADSQLTVEELHKIPCGDNQDRETENRFDDPGRHEFLKSASQIDSSKTSDAEKESQIPVRRYRRLWVVCCENLKETHSCHRCGKCS